MDITTIVVLATGLFTAVLLFCMIALGMKNRRKMHVLHRDFEASSTKLEGSAQDVAQAMKEDQRQQERILQRLENLEMIVTSEAWDALGTNEEASQKHSLSEGEVEEPDTETQAQHMAARVR